MRIDCYMSLRCGSEEGLRENISKALAMEGTQAEVNFHRLTDEEAVQMGLRGSPSIWINGEELQPSDITGFF